MTTSTSLLDAPIWNDPGTWIVLGISLLFVVVGVVMHHIIMKIVRQSAAMEAATPRGDGPPQPPRPAPGEHEDGNEGSKDDGPSPPQGR